jgi:hypothetical protein
MSEPERHRVEAGVCIRWRGESIASAAIAEWKPSKKRLIHRHISHAKGQVNAAGNEKVPTASSVY